MHIHQVLANPFTCEIWTKPRHRKPSPQKVTFSCQYIVAKCWSLGGLILHCGLRLMPRLTFLPNNVKITTHKSLLACLLCTPSICWPLKSLVMRAQVKTELSTSAMFPATPSTCSLQTLLSPSFSLGDPSPSSGWQLLAIRQAHAVKTSSQPSHWKINHKQMHKQIRPCNIVHKQSALSGL